MGVLIIRVAWYNQHLKNSTVKIVLLDSGDLYYFLYINAIWLMDGMLFSGGVLLSAQSVKNSTAAIYRYKKKQ